MRCRHRIVQFLVIVFFPLILIISFVLKLLGIIDDKEEPIHEEEPHIRVRQQIDESEYREFIDEESAFQWGNEHYTLWSEEYKRQHSIFHSIHQKEEVVKYYSGGFEFNVINNYMRGIDRVLRKYPHEQVEYFSSKIPLLLEVVKSSPVLPENIVLYRLVCDEFIHELLENDEQNKDTIEKGFISTSLLKNKREQRENYDRTSHMLKIYVDKGIVGTYLPLVVDMKFEQEMLLSPNGYFHLLKEPYKSENRKVYDKFSHRYEVFPTIIYECKLYYTK